MLVMAAVASTGLVPTGAVRAASTVPYLEPPAPTPPATPVPRATGKLVPEQGALFGLHTIPDGGPDGTPQGITTRETQLGRKLDIDNHYYTWNQTIPTWEESWDIQQGRIPLISWGGTDTRAIVKGTYDALIAQNADALKALGAPFFLRWFWEADGTRASKAGLSHSPAEYIAAWRYLYKKFADRGVTNAVWVWCPVSLDFYPKPRALNPAQPYYPGDDVVDWACADGYNWSPGLPGHRYESFQELFEPFYAFANDHHKPIMIGETGVQENNAGDKAKWFQAMHTSITQHYPNIQAFLYFDVVNANAMNYNWQIDTSPQAFAAFKDMANDPYFNQPHTGLDGRPIGTPGAPGPSPGPPSPLRLRTS